MAKKKVEVDPQKVEEIWAAGVISMSGSLSLVQTKHASVVRYVLTSSIYPEAMERFSKIAGCTVYDLGITGKKQLENKRISLQGAALHALLTRVWDYLTPERKRAYAKFRKHITSLTEGPNPYRDGENPDEYNEEI